MENIIAGALFDFCGYLTTLPIDQWFKVGSCHNVGPLLDHLVTWADERGLSLDDPLVKEWTGELYHH